MKAVEAANPALGEAKQSARPFGELLRIFRLRANYSQEGLAERARISVKAVSSIEQGARRAPYRQTVAQLAQALELSPPDRSALDHAAESARPRGRRAQLELPTPANNLPQSLTPFIDRPETNEIAALLTRHRLITISGSGGVGKTRTAIEVSYQHMKASALPAYFVDLSSLRDGTLIVGQIGAALGLRLPSSDEPATALVAALTSRNLFLVLDNCEHVLADVASVVGALLRGCASVSILITSREPLRLSNEVVYRLPSLAIPENGINNLEDAQQYAALALFMQRAQYADARSPLAIAEMPAIIDICRKLDGIPLAIELAAARVPMIGIEALRSRLEDAFILSGSRDLPPRQQTMEATIWWSFQLLNEPEQTLLRRLSVFVGGFTLESAEIVCSEVGLPTEDVAGLLTRLVDKSLANVRHVGDKPRYALLELIRTFSLQRLKETADYTGTARRHAAWLALKGGGPRVTMDEAVRMCCELDNMRAAIAWCLGSGSQADVALAARIVVEWRLVWGAAEQYVELRQFVADVLEKLEDVEANYALIAQLWTARVNSQVFGGHTLVLIQEATPFIERAGDAEDIAYMYANLALETATTGSFAQANELLAVATRYYEIDENRKKGSAYFFVSVIKSWMLCEQGQTDKARAELVELDRQMELHGSDASSQARRLQALAEIEFASGKTALAIELCGKALDLSERRLNSRSVACTVGNLSNYLVVNGDLDEAERCGKKALAHVTNRPFDESDVSIFLPVQHLAAIAAIRHRSHLAAALLGFIDASYVRAGVSRRSVTDKRSYDILVNSLNKQLSIVELAKLRVEGEALDFEAVRELLEIAPEEPGA